ncbi:galactokinase [Amphibiibacter pelophylacis]|uniref:Galactokinase n=1 Tax=Amphibiibacter pelophylacis TaxID=1799477 RepID=A0ACC6NZ24_9BURK
MNVPHPAIADLLAASPAATALHAAFARHYGQPPLHTVRAPGRVNLIGEHTDYNGGFVLPCAIDYQTLIALRPRPGRQVRVLALDVGLATDQFDLDAPLAPRTDSPWANYVRGMVQQVQQHLARRGQVLDGLDMAITGDVPQGAGLSSSAALEVAVGQALITAQGLDAGVLDAVTVAQLAQRAENGFVGCQCGIMDQLISACGVEGHALLIDCESLVTRPVPLPADMAVFIAHSRVQRGLVDSAYNQRRQQCEAAAQHYGVPSLRHLDEATLLARRGGLDNTAFRRARHIVTENRRTLAAADALAAGDLATLSQLMAQSHASMRDDFEITVPAIDHLVQILQDTVGDQGGARMTGGGFGGCVVALMPHALVPQASAALQRHYRAPSGEQATVYVCHASAGAGALPG